MITASLPRAVGRPTSPWTRPVTTSASPRPVLYNAHRITAPFTAPSIRWMPLRASAASRDEEPSAVGGEDEDEDDAQEENIVSKTVTSLVNFWKAADDTTRLMLVMLFPLAWFVGQTAMYHNVTTSISTFFSDLFRPASEWLAEHVVKSAEYRLLQIFSLPTTGKLWAVLGIGVITTFLGGGLYHLATGVPFSEALGKSYFTLNNVPGMDCTSDDSPNGIWVLNMIHILSLFTFAILVGILTDDISSAVEQVQGGNFKVPEKDHTVLLGWNSQTIPILNQVMKLHERNPAGVFSLPILILADRDKGEMDDELLDEFGPEVMGKKILTRQGLLVRKADMERVAVGKARTLMFLHESEAGDKDTDQDDDEMGDENGGDDGSFEVPRQAKLLAALANLKTIGEHETKPQNLVFQSRFAKEESYENDFACNYLLESFKEEARKYKTTIVYDMKSLVDVMAQCASQPGLADVFEQLFQRSNERDDPRHLLKNFPYLEGKTFGEVRRSFEGNTSVVGVLGKYNQEDTDQRGLNPPDDYVLAKEDELILLTLDQREDQVVALKNGRPVAEVPAHFIDRVRPTSQGKNYVVVAHHGDPTLMVQALMGSIQQEDASTKSSITVLTSIPVNRDVPRSTKKVAVKYLCGDLSTREMMLQAGVETADSVVIQLITEYPPQEADAQVLSTILVLNGVLDGTVRAKPLQVVCNVNDPEVAGVIHTLVDADHNVMHVDCIEPDKLLGGILTQVAATPELREVFEDLFDAEGDEIYAKPLEHYGLIGDGRVMEWSQLQEITRIDGDLLVGYVDKDENVRLAVSHDTLVSLEEGDRLVVLAEDMYTSAQAK